MIYTAANLPSDNKILCEGTPSSTGEGNFCGWYAAEYFLNCNIIAVIEKIESEDEIRYILHEGSGVAKAIEITSVYQSATFNAKSNKEAIKKFFNTVVNYDQNSCWWFHFNRSIPISS